MHTETPTARDQFLDLFSAVIAKSEGGKEKKKAGNKPLGAAFARAKRLQRENGGDHEDNLRRVNDYLRQQGHSPVKKGVFDRWRALSPDERVDEVYLRGQGFSHADARALAQAGYGDTTREGLPRKPVYKSDYNSAFVSAAKAGLPSEVHSQLHRKARAMAGGVSAGRKRRIANDSKGQALEQASKLLRAIMRAKPMTKSDGVKPPQGVQAACRRGLELAPEHGGPGLTEGAKSRARSMAAGNNVSLQNLKRMKSFFARHSSYAKEASPPSPGYVSWMLWGGDAGKSWAESQVKRLEGGVDKASPTFSMIDNNGAPGGSPAVAGPPMSRKDRLNKSAERIIKKAFPDESEPLTKGHVTPSLADQFIDDAFAGLGMQQDLNRPAYDPPEVAPFLDSQRLVQGMDVERSTGGISVPEARTRASRALARSMGAYEKSFDDDPELANVGGLNLDLGSGAAREAGYLGIDTYPYDYGTVIHDVGLGIPFPIGSARRIRMVNALDSFEDYRDDPTPLLREIQRVLGIGGKFIYQGSKLLDINRRQFPGLKIVASDMTEPLADEPPVASMVVKRVPAQLPIVYGADPDYLSDVERDPGQLESSEAAYGTEPVPELAMSNLVHKRESVEVEQTCAVIKADTMQQIVTGVVLSPNEVDSQGDMMTAEEIERTAHQFLIDARVVGNEHSKALDGAEVIESFIAPTDMNYSNDAFGPQVVKKGAWVLSVKIRNKKDWDAVLDGDFTGFSVGGYGKRHAA